MLLSERSYLLNGGSQLKELFQLLVTFYQRGYIFLNTVKNTKDK